LPFKSLCLANGLVEILRLKEILHEKQVFKMKMKNTALLSFLPLVNGNPPKSIVAHGHWCGFVKRAFIKTAGCGAAFVLVP